MKRLSRTSFRFSAKDPDKEKGSDPATSSNHQPPPPSPPASPGSTMRDLRDLLAEADLSEYLQPLGTRLKVTALEHLKYVKEEDLEEIGMTRPEMRRLKKFYRKETRSGAIGKLRKAIMRGGSDAGSHQSNRASSNGTHGLAGGTPFISHPQPIVVGQLEIAVESLQIQTGETPLGEGDFGCVQQAVWTTSTRDKVTVAAKCLHQDMVPGDADILKEMAPLQELDHTGLVKLYGVVHDQAQESWTLVYELAPLGSLLSRLRDESVRQEMALPRLCDFAQQVCEGMAYLETRGIVHRDLAARNVLVFSPAQVKISDTSLSKVLRAGPDSPDSNFWYSSKVPVAWYAPETIKSSKFSSASDVWSFGVLMWEIFSYGQQPWAEMTSSQIMEAVDEPSCLRLGLPDLCTGDLYQVMGQCWQHQPQARPSFASTVITLPQMRPTLVKALKDYPSHTPDKGYLYYRAGDIIVVLDKCPNTSAPRGLEWRGVMSNATTGLFDPTNVIPFIEPKVSPVPAKTTSLSRKESARGGKPVRKIRADMISEPQNDLRHTGHIGFDGAVFGDVSFIGDAYDKLPVRIEGASNRSSVSRSVDSPDRNGHVKGFNSQDSLDKSSKVDIGPSWLSRDSLSSQATNQSEQDGRQSPAYLDVADDSLFSDFKMPDLGSSLDFGPSFMDEMLKLLDEKERQVTEKTSESEGATCQEEKRESPCPVPTPAPRCQPTKKETPRVAPKPAPRADPPKEKKQPKVKPMSASDERLLDEALSRSREMEIAPISPGDKGGGGGASPPSSSFFNDDSPSIVTKLKNSIKRNGGEEEKGRQRTFSEELESRGDLDDEVTPEAQQAYNMLVVKGSFKEKDHPRSHPEREQQRSYPEREQQRFYPEVEQPRSYPEQEQPRSYPEREQPRSYPEREQPRSYPEREQPRSYPQNDQLRSYPEREPPRFYPEREQPMSYPEREQPRSYPEREQPRSYPEREQQVSYPEREQPRSYPEREQQRSNLETSGSDFLERDDQHGISYTASSSSSSSSLQVEHKDSLTRPHGTNGGGSGAGSGLDFLDHGDHLGISYNTTPSSSSSSLQVERKGDLDVTRGHGTNGGGSGAGGVPDILERGDQQGVSLNTTSSSSSSSLQTERKDSLTKRQGSSSGGFAAAASATAPSSSLFQEDLSEPSPQEIMSKLRERRLHRHLDHQRIASAAAGSEQAEPPPKTGIPRPRPSAREPQGIPGRKPSVDMDHDSSNGGGGGDGADAEEVDTNPLRMLRGGGIPIRTGRSTGAGRRIAKR